MIIKAFLHGNHSIRKLASSLLNYKFGERSLGYRTSYLQFIIPGCGDLLYLGHCSAFQKEHFTELWGFFS